MEITNIIYDTLMGNTNNEQLNREEVTNQYMDNQKDIISFDYKGRSVVIKIIS